MAIMKKEDEKTRGWDEGERATKRSSLRLGMGARVGGRATGAFEQCEVRRARAHGACSCCWASTRAR